MDAFLICNFSLCSFLLGVIAGSYYLLTGFSLIGIALLIFAVIVSKNQLRSLWLVILAFGLGWSGTSLWRQFHYTSYPLNQTVTLVGQIIDPPDLRENSQLLTFLPDGKSGAVLITASRYPPWQYGDRLRITGKLEAPQSFNGFNYPLYLERYHIYALMRQAKVVSLKSNQANLLLAGLYQLSTYFQSQIQHTLPEPESSFLGGILLGSKRAIPDDIQAALKQTGTSHIIAISGANITILLGLLQHLLPLYKKPQQFWSVVVVSIFVTLLTGASASVLRGAVVACVGSYLRLISRRAWATPLLLSTMTMLCLGNPLLLAADPGFQLSFAAFAGLAYLGAPLKVYLDKNRISHGWPEVIKASAAETTAATIATAPFSFFIFKQLSLLGLVVNPLVLWLLPFITLLGLVILLLSWLPFIIPLVRLPLWLLLHSSLTIITSFARLPVGVIHWPSTHAP